jgi:DNA-binding NarL/FixJ family response regulator
VVADDHPAMLAALGAFLGASGFDVVETAADGAAGLDAIERHSPELAVVDLRMPRLDGIELARRVRELRPETQVAVYSPETDADVAREALAAGATAFVLKEAPLDDLVDALNSVLRGRPYVDSGVAAAELRHDPRDTALTERECEVLELLADGLSHEQIGERLQISSETVRTHLGKARERLGAENRTHAVALALRRGLIG